MSESTINTFRPRSASVRAKMVTAVDLPSPWVEEVTPTMRMLRSARSRRKVVNRLRSDSLMAKRSLADILAMLLEISKPGSKGR